MKPRFDEEKFEAKIKIFENSSKKYSLGGAGNLCSNLKSLGINFKFYSEVGTDMNGAKIVHLLKNKIIYKIFKNKKISTLKKRFL